jgi:hypothetical protein
MELKSGTKTTEFWVAIAPILIGIVDGSKSDIETKKYLMLSGTILAGMYIVSRTIVKCKQ